ncbi:MAG: hypothetical protein AAF004_02735 [Pseudomonadota bacterium]
MDRIESLEAELSKAREYLADGSHSSWHGFRQFFVPKMRHGKALPPHRKWIENVFIPSRERALRNAEKILERMDSRDRNV